MSIAAEISRIQGDRNTIRNKMVALGVALSTDNLDQLATKIDGIVNRGAVSAEVQEGDSYTIPAGYHNGSTSATIDGLTTTSAVIPAGYTSGGTVALDSSIETALAAI